MGRECAFCRDAANLTGEHLWSDWIGKRLGARPFTFTRREADGNVLTWHDRKLNSKAKVVCEQCNGGWMSRLESRTKLITNDMILHCSQTTLEARDLATIAAFAFTKAVVGDHMQDSRPPFFTPTERRLFATSLSIPYGVQMWFASMSTQRGLFKGHYFKTPLGTPNGFEFDAFTYGIGHLVIQVVSLRWRRKAFRRHIPPPRMTQAVEWDQLSVPFWPNDGTPITWPPSAHLGDEIIETFVQRWEHLQRA